VVAPILENVDTFDGTEFNLKNDLGQLIAPSLQQLLGRQRGLSGNGQMIPGLSVPELTSSLDQIRLSNPNKELFGHGLASTRAAQTAAFQGAQQEAQYRRALIASGTTVTPVLAENDILADRQYTEYLRERGAVAPDAYAAHINNFADPTLVDVIKIARKGRNPNASVVWGDSAEAFFDKAAGPGGALNRITEYTSLRDKTLTVGLPARDVLVMDTSKIDEGTVLFRVDEDRVQRLFPGQDVPFGSVEQARVLGEAKEVARQLSAIVSRDLKAKAHIEFAQNGLPEVDYEGQWETGAQSFLNIFGTLEAVENGGN